MKTVGWICAVVAMLVAFAALAPFTPAVVLVGPLLAVVARIGRQGAGLPAVLTLLLCILAVLGSPMTMGPDSAIMLVVPGAAVAILLRLAYRRRSGTCCMRGG